MAKSDQPGNIEALLEVMRRLRDPVSGCPWDRKQSFATIAPYTIEEAYEVADAIGRGDMEGLQDELGDLLLQVVYHAQLAKEEGRFDFGGVVEAITTKMIRRHPHVFGDASAREAGQVAGMWEKIKAAEKARRGEGAQASVLDGVVTALPALTRAVKLQKRASRVGFDWPSLAPVLEKIDEEIAELKEVISDPAAEGADRDGERVAEELGDLLFAVANLARHLHIDPEAALRAANEKFVRRFKRIEAALASEDRRLEDATLEEMDALWDASKAAEANS